jgi:hypothetical protein
MATGCRLASDLTDQGQISSPMVQATSGQFGVTLQNFDFVGFIDQLLLVTDLHQICKNKVGSSLKRRRQLSSNYGGLFVKFQLWIL